MKISSVSKKVLASALSAAMVVAFAPTAAFGAGEQTVVMTNTYYNAQTGAQGTVDYYDADLAFAGAVAPENVKNVVNGSPVSAGYGKDKATATLNSDVTLTKAIKDTNGDTTLLVDLNGHAITSKDTNSETYDALTLVGEGSFKVASTDNSTFGGFTVGATVNGTDIAGDVAFSGTVNTNFGSVVVKTGSKISLGSGQYTVGTGSADAFNEAIQAAVAAGATVTKRGGTNPNYTWTAIDGVTAGQTVSANDVVKVAATVATATDANGVVTSYATLTDAVKANNVTVTLQADIVEEANIDASANKGVVIDLNGHSITRSKITAGAANATPANSKELTITGEGKLVGTEIAGTDVVIAESAKVAVETSEKDAKKNWAAAAKSKINVSKTVTVKGELTVADNAVADAALALAVERGGSVSVAKGDFTKVAVTAKAGGTVSIAKGTYKSLTVDGDGNAEVTGAAEVQAATFKHGAYVDIKGGDFTNAAITFDPDGQGANAKYNVSVTKGKFNGDNVKPYVVKESVFNAYATGKFEAGAPVAIAQDVEESKDGKTKYTTEVKCASLTGAAFNSDAAYDSTVTLTADIEEEAAVAANGGKKLTVDLAGHTVKGGLDVSGKVVLKGGTVNGYGREAIAATATADLTIEDGTYTAEVKVNEDKSKNTPTALTTIATNGKIAIKGGTFKAYKVNATNGMITGGTFDKEPAKALVDANYSVVKNEDGTFTVELTGAAKSNFKAVNGAVKIDGTFTVIDKDKALEAAVDAAYAKVVTAAWAADPNGTELAGVEFLKDDDGKNTTFVKDITGITKLGFALVAPGVANKDVAIKADKDYAFDGGVQTVKIAIQDNGVTKGYLTGVDIEVVYTIGAAFAQDTAAYTYGFVGGKDVKYDAEKYTYTFATTSSAQFAPERISNSILELQEQMKQIEIAAQDKAAASTIKGTAKSIKTKKGVTAKKYTAKVKAVTSESGAVATYKKANTAGKSKITVAKSGTITIKKGLKKGTYKVKVKGTVGASSKTVTAKIVIK